MAYAKVVERISQIPTFYADAAEDVTDIEDENPMAPVGSRILVAGDSAAPTEYIKFPSDWVQTNNFE